MDLHLLPSHFAIYGEDLDLALLLSHILHQLQIREGMYRHDINPFALVDFVSNRKHIDSKLF